MMMTTIEKSSITMSPAQWMTGGRWPMEMKLNTTLAASLKLNTTLAASLRELNNILNESRD